MVKTRKQKSKMLISVDLLDDEGLNDVVASLASEFHFELSQLIEKHQADDYERIIPIITRTLTMLNESLLGCEQNNLTLEDLAYKHSLLLQEKNFEKEQRLKRENEKFELEDYIVSLKDKIKKIESEVAYQNQLINSKNKLIYELKETLKESEYPEYFDQLYNNSDRDAFVSFDHLKSAAGVTFSSGLNIDYGTARTPPCHRNYNSSVFVLADSHGRDITGILRNCLPSKYMTKGMICPGGQLSDIDASSLIYDELSKLNCSDFVIIMGGSNNFSPLSDEDSVCCFINSLEDMILKYMNVNCIVANLPYRYDLPESSVINNLVKLANRKINSLCQLYNLNLLDLWTLERRYHTRHGLHLNRGGKSLVARRIKDLILGYGSDRNMKSFCEPYVGENVSLASPYRGTSSLSDDTFLTIDEVGYESSDTDLAIFRESVSDESKIDSSMCFGSSKSANLMGNEKNFLIDVASTTSKT